MSEKMEFGLCTIALSEEPITVALDIARECNCDGVEIWGKNGHLPYNASDREIESVKAMCSQRGLDIITYGSYLKLITDEFDNQYKQNIDCAAKLGARMIRIWAGNIPSKLAKDDIVANAVKQLKILADYATDKGITIVIENHDNSLADNSEMILRLIESVGKNNIKSYWQPSFREDKEDWYRALENLITVLGGIHAQNYSGGYNERKQTFNGDVNYKKIADILKSHKKRCPIFVEFPAPGEPKKTIADDIKFLKETFDF